MAFNFNDFKKVTFPITLDLSDGENGKGEQDLHVLAPSIAQYKDYKARREAEERTVDTEIALCCDILSHNEEGVRVPPEALEDLPISAVTGFCTAYFQWLADTRVIKN